MARATMTGRQRIARAAIGVLAAGVACFLALGLAGAGHGWVEPVLFSWVLFVVYPLVLLRSGNGPRWLAADLAVVVLALVLDVSIYLRSAASAGGVTGPIGSFVPGIDMSMLPFLVMWLGLWFHWQFIAVRSLWRDLRAVA